MLEEGLDKDCVLFSGYAKLPEGITATELYKVIGVVLVVDMKTGIIKEADCTLVTELTRKYVCKYMLGYDLNEGPDGLQAILDRQYQGSAKKAIYTAIRIIYDKYKSFKSGEK